MSEPTGTLLEDLISGADWISAALTSSGYRADFSGESLRELDRFFDEHTTDGAATPGGLLSEDLGSRLFAIGAYLGEVVRRAKGGTWQTDDEDPEGEINVALLLPDGAVVLPTQRAMKRFQGGAEEGLAAYGAALGVDVGAGS